MHWRYIFLTRIDIEMILGDILLSCIPSSGEKFKYVAFVFSKMITN